MTIRKRLACLLTTALLLCAAGCAAAEGTALRPVGIIRAAGTAAERGAALYLANGAVRTVYFMPVPGAYYALTEGQIDALEVPPVNDLRASSSKGWLEVKPMALGFRWGVTKVNASQKTRGATLTLKGAGYTAKVKVKQLGADRISSAKRSGNKVTVKLKLSNSPAHAYTVLRTKLVNGKPAQGGAVIVKQGEVKGSKLTFKVKKGYQYLVCVGSAVKLKDGTCVSCDTAAACFTVRNTAGSQKADYILKLGSDGKLN